LIDYALLVPVGYLLGSLPFGVLVGRLVKRIDIREHGSGNAGMTNVIRLVGTPAGILVLALDMGKAALAVGLALLFSDSAGVAAGAGLAALAGHIWPVFVGFRGGRGTASGWGALFVLSPVAGLAATVIGLALVALTRYVSVGSIFGATAGGLTLAGLSLMGLSLMGLEHPSEYLWFGLIGTVLIVLRHKENIQRLLNGEEHRLGHTVDTLRGGC
jgi:glycerol-3-phosphate acyltransferase PlsY